MKNLILFISYIFLLSCSALKRHDSINTKTNPTESDLTIVESAIINDFLDAEFKKDRYKNYKDYQLLLIKEANSKFSSLTIYGYCYDERNLKIRSASNKDWILDRNDIKNIQDTINKSKKYLWKESDVKNFKVGTIEKDAINQSIKKASEYEKYNNSLIIYLSIPLIVKSNYAFVSYRCDLALNGYKIMDMFTVLLKKSENGNWEIDSYYYDPNTSW